MVGVPGKFKGCETCRLRRVKVRLPRSSGSGVPPETDSLSISQCDNGRPFCKKCIDSGRDCAGYERETVFIIGTVEDGGRCSSHPPRVVRSKKAKAEKLELGPVQPLQPAWDDLVSLSSGEALYSVQIAALHTNLQTVSREIDDGNDSKITKLSLQPYSPADTRPSANEEDFELRSQCVVHLSAVDDNRKYQTPSSSASMESACLFLYQVSLVATVGHHWPCLHRD